MFRGQHSVCQWCRQKYCSGLVHSTLPIMKKKYAEILLHYRWLFIKDNVFIGEWGIFGAEVFLCYSWFFIKGNFFIGGIECITRFDVGSQLQFRAIWLGINCMQTIIRDWRSNGMRLIKGCIQFRGVDWIHEAGILIMLKFLINLDPKMNNPHNLVQAGSRLKATPCL